MTPRRSDDQRRAVKQPEDQRASPGRARAHRRQPRRRPGRGAGRGRLRAAEPRPSCSTPAPPSSSSRTCRCAPTGDSGAGRPMRLPESAAATAPRHRRAKINATCPEPPTNPANRCPASAGNRPRRRLPPRPPPRSAASHQPATPGASPASRRQTPPSSRRAARRTHPLRNSGVRRYEIYWARSPDKSASQYGVLAGLPVQLRHELSAPVRNRPLCQRPALHRILGFIHAGVRPCRVEKLRPTSV